MVEKKTKGIGKRAIIVLVVILIFTICMYVNLRGEYLKITEINPDFIEIYNTNFNYLIIVGLANFIILFLAMYITAKIIKHGLKKFFLDDGKEMPKLPNKSIALITSLIVMLFTTNIIKEKVMFFVNATQFGIDDPVFGMDLGYYIFGQPFIEFILTYLIAITAICTIYTVVYYIVVFNKYFDGIDLELLKKSTFIKQIIVNAVFITGFISIFTFIKSSDVLFSSFLTINKDIEAMLYGAGVMDVTLKVWGYRILSFVIFISVIFAIKYIKKGEKGKAVKWVLVVPAYLVCLFIIMTAVDLIFINPNEYDRQKQYISYNIENTKQAYDIAIEEKEIDYSGNITQQDMNSNESIFNNIAIVNRDMVLENLEKYQKNLGYYTYKTAQIGRYAVDETDKLVYVTPREIRSNSSSYSSKTYEYTHGYSVIITSATSTDADGNIEYIQSDFENNNKINITNPRIYYGLETNNTVIVGNKPEYDYPISSTSNTEYEYKGDAGLNLGFLDRVILGISEKNFNLAFGASDENKILINRNIINRAKTVMPYLLYDENPYLVIRDDGSLVWVLDAYTTTDKYPYSTQTTIQANGAKTKINYIRNSVKVLVDAYSGEIQFYLVDKTDPIAVAYNNIYPNLFVSQDENIPQDILKHMVYPEYLYNIQAEMLNVYHNVQPEVLYRSDDIWQSANYNSSTTSIIKETQIEPLYTLIKENNEERIGLIQCYSPINRENINSYLIGSYNSNGEKKLTLYKFKQNNIVLGPMQIETQIEQDEGISAELETLKVTGTRLIKDMIVIPVGNTILYVEPIYQVNINSEAQTPLLKKVIVASGNKLAIGNNITSALDNLVSKYAVDIEYENTEDLEGLIEAIIKANTNLKESSINNDWELIGKDLKRLQDLITQLEEMQQDESQTQENTIVENVIEENIIQE